MKRIVNLFDAAAEPENPRLAFWKANRLIFVGFRAARTLP